MNLHVACFSVLVAFALTVVAQTAGAGEPPPEAVVERLSAEIRRLCPEARISVDGEKFVARHGTMTFTLHNRSKTGEISPETHQAEGPNYRGFILTIAREPGPYQGAAEIPQTLDEPYFSTFINAVPTADGRGHLRIGLSYGRQIDEQLKQALLAALPTSKLATERQPPTPKP